MSSVKSFKFLLLSAVGCLCASACSLPAPGAPDGGFHPGGKICTISADAGAVDFGSSVVATGDVENVVTPVACAGSGTGNPNAIDKYSQGYDYKDPMILAKVSTTMSNISVRDEMWQMGGMPYGSPAGKNYTNTQRSQDTDTIRGFRYRDASRGVNLHEDMDGNHPSNLGVDGKYNVGYATAFPVSMARGAAFDLDLEYAVGEAIADEMQAIGETLLLAPCMNILRHPYWGRAQEVYGEDNYETGRLASAMTIGIQEHIAANAKHYMAYDVEASRQTNVSLMDEQTLRETYGRHFRMVVQDAGVSSVMASYNSVGHTTGDAQKSTINVHTLKDVLRNDFGFKGFILSDWWAVPGKDDILDSATQTSTAKNLFTAGLDVELPWLYNYSNIQSLVNNGDIKKADLDTAVSRILYEKYRFNADTLSGTVGLKTPVSIFDAGKGVITCDYTHVALAKKAAVESMVLLKNDNGVLPISPSVHKLAVVGATVPFNILDIPLNVNFATDVRTGDFGSSRVDPDPKKSVGPFAGFCQATGGTVSEDGKSCNGGSVNVTTATNDSNGDLSAVMNAANGADFVVVMAGLTPRDEGEEYTFASDRSTNCQDTSSCLELDAKQTGPFSGIQDKLIQQVAATHKPMVVVLEGGSVINVPWLSDVPALVMAWYPGQRGGEAIADLLWGQVNGVSYNFGGKLPFTWGLEQQYGDPFDTQGGTTQFNYYIGYRYFDQKKLTPVFPFGAGHSYTNFALTNLQLGCSSMEKGAVLPVVVNVTNTGMVAGDDTVMVFVHFPNTQARRSFKELKGFARVSLAAGESKQVTVPVRLSDLDYFQTDSGSTTNGHWVVEDGPVDIMVTDGSQNSDGTTAFLPTQTVNVSGYQVGSAQ